MLQPGARLPQPGARFSRVAEILEDNCNTEEAALCPEFEDVPATRSGAINNSWEIKTVEDQERLEHMLFVVLCNGEFVKTIAGVKKLMSYC